MLHHSQPWQRLIWVIIWPIFNFEDLDLRMPFYKDQPWSTFAGHSHTSQSITLYPWLCLYRYLKITFQFNQRTSQVKAESHWICWLRMRCETFLTFIHGANEQWQLAFRGKTSPHFCLSSWYQLARGQTAVSFSHSRLKHYPKYIFKGKQTDSKRTNNKRKTIWFHAFGLTLPDRIARNVIYFQLLNFSDF